MNTDYYKAIRKGLHQNAELSGQEVKTALIIVKELEKLNPTCIFTKVGGHGVLAVFDSNIPGRNILFRADIDALPIMESNAFEYKSLNYGVSHKCGHDGHAASLLRFASYLSLNRPQQGKVILFFQAAEETGQGAFAAMQDQRFLDLKPDYVFAWHNIPSYPLGQVVMKGEEFSAASKGLIINLKGKSSHASEPHKGISPALALSRLIREFSTINSAPKGFSDFVLLTIIHAKLGEVAFGTNPGDATLMLTLRSFKQEDMTKLEEFVKSKLKEICTEEKLSYTVSQTEVFPVTYNDPELVNLFEDQLKEKGVDLIMAEEPFPWSEDFGCLTSKHKGFLFGIGAGTQHPELHHPDYDFPDELIEVSCHRMIDVYGLFGNLD
jgi:amidohydrolase